jgi:exosortase A
MHSEPQVHAQIATPRGALGVRALLPVVPCLVVVFAWHWETTLSMVAIWRRSETFTHGFVVLPIVLYLVWRAREASARIPAQPCYAALLGIVGSGLVWLLGELASVVALTHFGMVAMVPFTVWAVLGTGMVRALAFPLAFLFFAVPFGDFLVPTLIDRTADFTIAALRLSGVPVYREGNYFQIPTGSWSVVEACSGVRYLIASVMVGCLYAYLTYRSLKRRLIFVGVSIVVPIIANWVRAYMIVMLGHLSENRIAAGVDHVIYGWVFFGVVIALVFWVGSRWREDTADAARAMPAPAPANPGARRSVLAASLAALVLIAVWKPVGAALEPVDRRDAVRLAPIAPAHGWTPLGGQLATWRPHFVNASREVLQVFAKDGEAVAVYIGYYRNQTQQAELVTWRNQLVSEADPRWFKSAGGTRDLTLGSAPIRARTAELTGPGARLLAWQWYWVDGRVTASDHLAKLYLVAARLLGRGDDSAVIVVFTRMADSKDGGAAPRLAAFTGAMWGPIERALEEARGR